MNSWENLPSVGSLVDTQDPAVTAGAGAGLQQLQGAQTCWLCCGFLAPQGEVDAVGSSHANRGTGSARR